MSTIPHSRTDVTKAVLLFVLFYSSCGQLFCPKETKPQIADATVKLTYVASLRQKQDDISCSDEFSKQNVQAALAVEWVINRLNNANNGTGYIPDVKIGLEILDDCQSTVTSARNALAAVDQCSNKPTDPLNIGIVGPSRSSTAKSISSLLKNSHVPIISPSATLADLSDKDTYPNFFRTVPSDKKQMMLIVDLLVALDWTYVGVVHETDEYGASAKDILLDVAKEKGVCIHKTVGLNSKMSETAKEEELRVLQSTAKDSSIGVVFIGGTQYAKELLFIIEKKLLKKFGIHLILTDAMNTDGSIFDKRKFGQGTLSIATPSSPLQDYYTDTHQLFETVKKNTADHELLSMYHDSGEDNLFIGGKPAPYVTSTVHAVFALVEALKTEHLRKCAGSPGLCTNLKEDLENKGLISAVKDVQVEYFVMDADVAPEHFRNQNTVLKFDNNGDIDLTSGEPSYSIHQFNKTQNRYEQVGSYIEGQMTLKKDKLKMTSPEGNESKDIPSSMCQDNCQDCLYAGQIPIVLQEGDAYILGIFPIHDTDPKEPFKCGDFRKIGYDAIHVEGFLFAVKQISERTGINFGAVVIDDCYSKLRVTTINSYMFSHFSLAHLDIFKHPEIAKVKEKLVAVLGCLSSDCTITAGKFFMPLKVPMISYAASSPDLDDRVNFPYFLRTVPSDIFQAQVMIDIIKKLGLEYVGMLYVKNNYGTKGMQAFKELARKEGICVAQEVGITDRSDQPYSDTRAIEDIVTKSAKLVVFFGIDRRFSDILKLMDDNSNYYGRFVFLASEDWGDNQNILEDARKAARGSITLKLEAIALDSESEFKSILNSKIPTKDDPNIWFREFWQNQHQCYFEGGFNNDFPKVCDASQPLKDVEKRLEDARLRHVINAVYAIGQGMSEIKPKLCADIDEKFPCSWLRNEKRLPEVVDALKKQMINDGQNRIFDENGNGAIGYEILNIQNVNGVLGYQEVGKYRYSEKLEKFETDKLIFYDEVGIEQKGPLISNCDSIRCSHCTDLEQPGAPPKANNMDGEERSLNDYRTSDIVLTSLVVVLILAFLVAIAAICLCCKRKYSEIEKKLNDKQTEEIYDVPHRQVFQGDYVANHRLQFVKESPYPANTRNINGAVNPAFDNDHLDSISQANLRRNHAGTPSQASENGRSNNPSSNEFSTVSSRTEVRPTSINSRRSQPAIPGYLLTETAIRKPSPQHIDDELAVKFSPVVERFQHPQMLRQGSNFNGSTSDKSHSPQPPFGSLHVSTIADRSMIPTTVTSLNDSPQSPTGIVYYMQGPNGQLAPHISPGAENYLPTQNSQNPNAAIHGNYSINPEYGPYNLALARQATISQENLPDFVEMHEMNDGNPGNMNVQPQHYMYQTNNQSDLRHNLCLDLNNKQTKTQIQSPAVSNSTELSDSVASEIGTPAAERLTSSISSIPDVVGPQAHNLPSSPVHLRDIHASVPSHAQLSTPVKKAQTLPQNLKLQQFEQSDLAISRV